MDDAPCAKVEDLFGSGPEAERIKGNHAASESKAGRKVDRSPGAWGMTNYDDRTLEQWRACAETVLKFNEDYQDLIKELRQKAEQQAKQIENFRDEILTWREMARSSVTWGETHDEIKSPAQFQSGVVGLRKTIQDLQSRNEELMRGLAGLPGPFPDSPPGFMDEMIRLASHGAEITIRFGK